MHFGAAIFFTDYTLRRYRDAGVVRAVVSLPSEQTDSVLPILDRWAKLIPRMRD